VLAAASVVMLGADGLSDYRSLLAEAQTVVNNRYFTTAYVLGSGALSYVAEAVVLIVAAVAAYAQRHAPPERSFALGLVASALGATYWHLQDFTVLLVAAWLFWRAEPPAWQRAWLAVVALTLELAWPLTPLPLLIAIAAWFAFLCVPQRSEPARLSVRPA